MAMPFMAKAQEEPLYFTVEEAVQYAIVHNTDLKKAEIDERISQAQVVEVKGQALPQINGSGGFSDNFSLAEKQLPAEMVGGEPGTTIGVTFGNRYSLIGGVNVQQQLLDFKL